MKKHLLTLFGVLALCGASTSLYGQQNSYGQTNLEQNADQQSVGLQGTQVQQRNGTMRSKPAGMSTNSRVPEVNGACESGDSRSEADRRTHARREAIEKLTEAQQTHQ
jgi:hypothetical protein